MPGLFFDVGAAAPAWRAAAILILACSFSRLVGAASDVLPENIRPTTPYLQELMETGYHDSTTFRHLIDQLSRLPVVLHILPSSGLRHPLAGELRLAGSSGALRYLRISIQASLRSHSLIAALGHELQHALEIAQAPAVADEASLRSFYRARGERACGFTFGECFETGAARAVGRAVREDLAGADGGLVE